MPASYQDEGYPFRLQLNFWLVESYIRGGFVNSPKSVAKKKSYKANGAIDNPGSAIDGVFASTGVGEVQGISVASNGNVFLADRTNSMVIKISTPWGLKNIWDGFNEAYDVGVISSGAFYVSDFGGHYIVQYLPDEDVLDFVCGSALGYCGPPTEYASLERL